MLPLLAICIGYLLGSILPADLWARSRGIDIRAVGTGNPGATNAVQQLGLSAGLISGAYDTSVGLVSMYVASRLGLPDVWVYLAGVAAIVGHCYPVFFGFRGGQGMAASTGMLIYGMGVALADGWLSVPGIALLAVLAVAAFGLTRSATVVGVIVAPLLIAEIALGRPDLLFFAFMTGLAGFIWVVQLGIARREQLFRVSEPVRSWVARAGRPAHGGTRHQ